MPRMELLRLRQIIRVTVQYNPKRKRKQTLSRACRINHTLCVMEAALLINPVDTGDLNWKDVDAETPSWDVATGL